MSNSGDFNDNNAPLRRFVRWSKTSLLVAVSFRCNLLTLRTGGRAQSAQSRKGSGGCNLTDVTASEDDDRVTTQNGQVCDQTAVPSLPEAHHDRDDWVTKWLRVVDKTRAEQPHYVAPLVTTHVLLVQQYRFDSSWQTNANGSQTDNYGNSHGFEIIPNSRFEVQVAQPHIVNSASPSGAGDTSLFVKFRAMSAPEGDGEYFIGLFLGASFPTGNTPNGAGHMLLSPVLALAKGWGDSTSQTPLQVLCLRAMLFTSAVHSCRTPRSSTALRKRSGR